MRLAVSAVICAACSFHVNATAPGDGASDTGRGDGAGTDAPLASCTDQVLDGDETDLDCGGSCGPCGVGKVCNSAGDCDASICDARICRVARHCRELHLAFPALGDASYVIDPDGAAAGTAVTTYCDMSTDGGGWTLVGKVDGKQTMYTTWLISTVNEAALQTPTITASGYACIDAVELAVNGSSEIRLSNSARTLWAKWPLPAGRAIATWWRHSVGQSTINGAADDAVTVTTSSGATMACFQNVYGILPFNMHGGSYPYAAKNTAGNIDLGDNCFAVGVQASGNADGFSQNGNGFDAPSDEATWPNPAYNISPHVAVWLR
ncbi:MAG: hypothetical protein IPQ07_15965 [Myxococcales bacterium]|nr:hypothetical protein [Myxococcales bacterium]